MEGIKLLQHKGKLTFYADRKFHLNSISIEYVNSRQINVWFDNDSYPVACGFSETMHTYPIEYTGFSKFLNKVGIRKSEKTVPTVAIIGRKGNWCFRLTLLGPDQDDLRKDLNMKAHDTYKIGMVINTWIHSNTDSKSVKMTFTCQDFI